MAETNTSRMVVQRTEFAAYGEPLNRTVDGQGYTGHVHDDATGLVYAQQRYYDPVVGRFLSGDPMEVDSTSGWNFNRYAYANNNPYKFTDPDGRNTVLGAAVGCAVTGPVCPAGAAAGALIGTAVVLAAGIIVYSETGDESSGSRKSDSSGHDASNVDPASGSEKDPADGSGQLTKAGRAQQKHGDRTGSAFDPALGTPDDKNAQGQNTIDDIMNSSNKTTEPNQRGGTDVREEPDGRGARFDKDGKFSGFIEPRK